MEKKGLIIIIGLIIILVGLVVFVLKPEKTQESGLAFLAGLLEETGEEKIVRPPAVAGQFYPADPEVLAAWIDEFLARVHPPETEPAPEGEIIGLILPHAGYQFSGWIAAYGFKTLLGEQLDTVILIGSSHYDSFEGISVFPTGFYKTPLGKIEIDSELAQKIIQENERIFFRETAHQKEHSLEVELPFLQRTLTNFKIVPIIFGSRASDDYKILAQALLKNIKGRNVLLLASSDLSHYPSYENARSADSKTIGAILTGTVGELEKTIQSLEKEKIPNAVTFACGVDAIKTVMLVAKELGAEEIKLLSYANSGDVSGDKSRVVGYAAIGFFGEARFPAIQEEEELLNKAEQQKLLAIARASVETFIREGKVPKFQVEEPALNQNLGAFVTLRKQGLLRGCIGRFSPTDIPLHQVVTQMAAAAASQDIRFPPVAENELRELHYDISVLSPLKRIQNWQEIELGKHGVQIRKGGRSGVFLPQVAIDMAAESGLNLDNPDLLDKFMGELCRQKAGLSWDCWKQKDVELYTFTAQVFEEE